jgi:pyridoxal phosphate enzyme (YggS family)
VEDALPKIEAIAGRGEIEWHLVGPLQSRKIRLTRDRFALIHAVDRLKVARLLDEQARALDRRQPILVECNVSGEATKSGWRISAESLAESTLAEFRQIAALPGLAWRGLMTVGVQTTDVDAQHRVFRRLVDLRRRLQTELDLELPELSMGMTDDFEAAVEDGATLVRIGRAILGERM